MTVGVGGMCRQKIPQIIRTSIYSTVTTADVVSFKRRIWRVVSQRCRHVTT